MECRAQVWRCSGGRDGSLKLWNFAGHSRDGLCARPGLECLDGLHPPSEQIEAPPATLAETAPFAHQCSIAKECRLDREHIEPGHVTGRIAAFEHEVLYREFGHVPESHLPNPPST